MHPVIQLTNVFKNYGDKTVLKGINLTINAGQVIGYIGPNGAGKSTTVKILCGLISDYEGTVTVAGMETTGAILTVITFFLLKHPDKLRILQSELRTAIPDATSLPSHQQLEKLRYLVRIQDGLPSSLTDSCIRRL